MRWIVVLALMLTAPAAAQEKMRVGEFLAMSPQRIADTLLPEGHVPIAKAVFDRMGDPRPPAPFVPTIHSLRFFTTSVPVGADFCAQDEIVAEITPMPDAEDEWLDAPPRLLRQTKGRRLYRHRALGAACDGSQPHFAIYGMPVEQGLEAFRALINAVRHAGVRSRKPLPFTVSCQAMICGGPRTVMRNLLYGEIISIESVPQSELGGRDQLSLLERMSGRIAVKFGLPMSGMSDTNIRVVLFQGRIEHLAVDESFVVF